jgi:hypothetical protein
MAIILLSTVTCVEPDNGNGIKEMSAYFNDKLDVSDEQVWMPNYNTGKVSQMLLKFKGDRDVDVIVIDYTDVPIFNTVGSGKIEKGILNFKVDEMNDSNLLDSDDLLYYYFKDWYKNGDNLIMTPEVKGNVITLVTLYNDTPVKMPSEAVIREGFSGTNDSLTGEYIYYLYVESDCTISVKEEVNKPEFQYTFKKFDDLSLKAGWNTILKSETYTTTGDSSYSMAVKNPAIRWVMQKTK